MMSKIAVEQVGVAEVRAILALFAELLPSVALWKDRLSSFLGEIASGNTRAKTVEIGVPCIYQMELCCTGDDKWFIVVEGQILAIEQFAHLLCVVCGVKKQVVVDGHIRLTALQATILA